jgi:hypothetical protein
MDQGVEKMKANRKTATIVGVLFIIGTVSGILSAIFTGSILGAPDYLAQVAANEIPMITGAFFVLLMGLSLAMVPVMMYPLFKKQNEALALGTVVFRGPLEAATYIFTVVSWLLLIVVSREYANLDASAVSGFQALGTVLRQTSEVINPVLEIVFSLGALMFYTLFYQTKLIPRWLSAWGLIGAVVYLAAGVLALFGVGMDFLLALLGVQEMVMALWLIFKGFNPSTTVSEIRS